MLIILSTNKKHFYRYLAYFCIYFIFPSYGNLLIPNFYKIYCSKFSVLWNVILSTLPYLSQNFKLLNVLTC